MSSIPLTFFPEGLKKRATFSPTFSMFIVINYPTLAMHYIKCEMEVLFGASLDLTSLTTETIDKGSLRRYH